MLQYVYSKTDIRDQAITCIDENLWSHFQSLGEWNKPRHCIQVINNWSVISYIDTLNPLQVV